MANLLCILSPYKRSVNELWREPRYILCLQVAGPSNAWLRERAQAPSPEGHSARLRLFGVAML